MLRLWVGKNPELRTINLGVPQFAVFDPILFSPVDHLQNTGLNLFLIKFAIDALLILSWAVTIIVIIMSLFSIIIIHGVGATA